jgi:hypothetical protein
MMQWRDDSDPERDHDRVARMVWHGGTHIHDLTVEALFPTPDPVLQAKSQAEGK